MSGKQIRLFLVDGTPGGLTTAEITNWTGHVLTGPRSGVGALLKREEARRTGVYLLLGDDEQALGDTRCYIGEADIVAERLGHHLREKEFWDRVVVITSKDADLTKSHGRYLESKLIALAKKAGRVTLENGTAPPAPPLPEADCSDMDEFLAQLHIVLPVLGVNAIRARPIVATTIQGPVPAESPIFTLANPSRVCTLVPSRSTANSLSPPTQPSLPNGVERGLQKAPGSPMPPTAQSMRGSLMRA